MAFRIVAAAIKDASPFTAPFDHLPFALGTLNADLLEDGLGVLTLGKARTCQELAETPMFDHQVLPTQLTNLLGDLVGEGDFLHMLLSGIKLLGKGFIELLHYLDPVFLAFFDLI